RINPAPETVAYIIGIFTLFLATKAGSRPTMLIVLCVIALVITHPLTPVLLLPLLVVFSLWRPLGRPYTLVATRGALVLSSVFGWLSFRSDWIITGALAVLFKSANYETEVSRQALPPFPLAPLYYYFYALALLSLAILVIATLLLCRRTRFGKGLT